MKQFSFLIYKDRTPESEINTKETRGQRQITEDLTEIGDRSTEICYTL